MEYYTLNWGADTLIEATSWILYDVFSIAAGILLLIMAIKVLTAKT